MLIKSHEFACTADNRDMQARQLLDVKEVTQEPRLLQTTVYRMSRNRSFNGLHVGGTMAVRLGGNQHLVG